jgi:hypothetical protein
MSGPFWNERDIDFDALVQAANVTTVIATASLKRRGQQLT